MPGPVSESLPAQGICRCGHFEMLHDDEGACECVGEPSPDGCTCLGYEADPDPQLYRDIDFLLATYDDEDAKR